MEYCLGDPDGSATMWTSPADIDLDGDGAWDAVGLDIDGDGLRDDVFVDLDHDGLADHAVLNRDGGGTAQGYLTDDGSGTWTVSADRGGTLCWFGLDGVEHPASGAPVDLDGDGDAGERLTDTDGDGLADRAYGTGAAWADTDGDGKWDLRLGDADGDGRADSADYL